MKIEQLGMNKVVKNSRHLQCIPFDLLFKKCDFPWERRAEKMRKWPSGDKRSHTYINNALIDKPWARCNIKI